MACVYVSHTTLAGRLLVSSHRVMMGTEVQAPQAPVAVQRSFLDIQAEGALPAIGGHRG